MVVDRQRADSEDLPQPVSTTNLHAPIEPNSKLIAKSDRFTDTATPSTLRRKLQDWSNSATELIDTTPLPWTRGLLYFLLIFIAVILPWAFLYKMDEIGTARGRLEFKGNTIKREADIEGSVAVQKVFVKKGDSVKAGQIIMELDAKSIREQIYQTQLKLDGQQQRLHQLELLILSALKRLRFLKSPDSELQRRAQVASTDST